MVEKISNKLGIPTGLFYGYVGLVFFMLGAGIETSWFSAYLASAGYKVQLISMVFSLYGLFVAVFSWLTSFLSTLFSIRRVMLTGLIVYCLSTGLLISALIFEFFPLIAGAYMLRGAAYPLFAYAFLMLITLKTELKSLGKATSWFWFSFNLGMTILSPLIASSLLQVATPITILLLGIVIVLVGGSIALKTNDDSQPPAVGKKSLPSQIAEGITILFECPRLALGLLVKAINNIGQFGFVIMMPIFLIQYGYTLTQWGSIWALTYVVNSIAGLAFGWIGDRYGWRKTVCYFSGTITALSCLLIGAAIFYFPGNTFLLALSFIGFSIGIAAFGPLSALIPAMVPDKKATALSVLNLGSGLSNFFGPVLITILFQKFGGFVVLGVFAGLYLLASGLAVFLKTPAELGGENSKQMRDASVL
ncbi:MFS transporter [Enterococcus florum]|uniref:MFS transporter n=1 Tax=Enterococcus florum TaxID=2480627 RepID=A0A4P5P977_9ENTE|nr:RbtT/DalT/CsbX family MFS transporter [Enterococcus florum]GCF94625.1 MFS transporter [Enterococcus florum]